jgi:ribulose-phosphate 3-epimerase
VRKLDSLPTVGYYTTVPLVAPSILSADFARLGDEVAAVTVAGADWIHVDVMDGHFVPPITIGPLVVRGIRKATRLPLDVHLMIEHPERQLDEFVKAGADRITVHVEACADLPAVLEAIRKTGAKAGLSLNPPTPVEAVRPYLHFIDLLLVMSVNPGWGGQPFVEGSMERLAAVRAMRAEARTNFLIEVDGGIYPHNAAMAAASGADVLVAGTAVFKEADYAAAITALRGDTHTAASALT